MHQCFEVGVVNWPHGWWEVILVVAESNIAVDGGFGRVSNDAVD